MASAADLSRQILRRPQIKSPSTTDDLPTDILHIIQKCLPLDDYFRFAAVCNSWRFAAKQNPNPPKHDEIPWLFLFHYQDNYDIAYAIRFSPQNNSSRKIYKIPIPKSFRRYYIVSSVDRHLIIRKMGDKSAEFSLVNPFSWTQIGCLPSPLSFTCPLNLIASPFFWQPRKVVTDGSTAVALFQYAPAYATLGSDSWIGLHETIKNPLDFYDVISDSNKPGLFYIARSADYNDAVGALHFDFSSSHRDVVSWVDMTLNLREDYISKEDTSLLTEEGCLKELQIFEDMRLIISSSNLFLLRWRIILTKDEMKRREVIVYKLLDDDTHHGKRWVLVKTLGNCSFFVGDNQSISLSAPQLRSNCIYFSNYPFLGAKNDYWPNHGSDFEHCWIYNLGDECWERLYDADDQFYSYMDHFYGDRWCNRKAVWITPCLDNHRDSEGASHC